MLRFANIEIDSARRELRRDGELVAVEPQVFDLVLYLIGNRDRVVTRDDLIEHVWKGRIVSESTLATRLNSARRALGDDGERQALIKTVARKGVRFVGEITEPAAPSPLQSPHSPPTSFCRTPDGVTLAISAVGNGPPLVKTSNWINHLEHDWQSSIWGPLFSRLAQQFKLIRYDGRGNGLADRDVTDISLRGFEIDLETVIDTFKLQRFALLGLSQGGAAAISYAVKYPQRVSHLILYGAYAQGRNVDGSDAEREKAKTILALMHQGWGDENSAFMRAFSSLYLPNGTKEQIRSFADMQRVATTGEQAARLRVACDDIDVLDLLPRIAVPTLVIHANKDNVVPFEKGRQLASLIPNAEMVTIDSENHVPLPGEPAWEQFVSEIERFASR